MISTGLPELSSEQDLNIIRNTLNLYYSKEDALENFRRAFDEALKNDWKISVDMTNQAFTIFTFYPFNDVCDELNRTYDDIFNSKGGQLFYKTLTQYTKTT